MRGPPAAGTLANVGNMTGVRRRRDGSVRVGPTPLTRVAEVVSIVVLPCVVFAIEGFSPAWLAVSALLVVMSDRLTCRRGLTLRPDAAVVHRPFSSLRIPWSGIQAVTVEDDLGCCVLLWTSDRTRHRLAAPATWRRTERFDAIVDVIGRWWLDHRGSDWTPLWMPTEAPTLAPAPPAAGFNPLGSADRVNRSDRITDGTSDMDHVDGST